jgi:hypothetical protein
MDIEEDMQIIREGDVKKEQNGRKAMRRLKPTVGCNASNRIR